MHKKTETSWGKAAGWYDDLLKLEGTYQKDVILPNLLHRMKLQRTENVLDLACGQGFFTHAFAKQARTAVGTDISRELIAIANKRIAPALKNRLSFFQAPAHDARAVPNRSVNHLTIVLAIQNIENVGDVFAECRRILRPDVTLHLVLNHPAFRIPKASEWGWDAAKQIQYRRVDAYLTATHHRIQMHPGSAPGVHTVSFHRPLQYYASMLEKNRLCISALEEWVSHKHSDSGPRAAAENISRKEFPLFLYLAARPHER